MYFHLCCISSGGISGWTAVHEHRICVRIQGRKRSEVPRPEPDDAQEVSDCGEVGWNNQEERFTANGFHKLMYITEQ